MPLDLSLLLFFGLVLVAILLLAVLFWSRKIDEFDRDRLASNRNGRPR